MASSRSPLLRKGQMPEGAKREPPVARLLFPLPAFELRRAPDREVGQEITAIEIDGGAKGFSIPGSGAETRAANSRASMK